ncbi:MAG TPA: Ig-like domain-containing protein [Acidimicrobiales bacterium]|nr:Ig-like domain-containing protein [Acidimicrobiales bacterium]
MKNEAMQALARYSPPSRRRRRWFVALAVVLVLGLTAAAAWFVAGRTSTVAQPGGPRHRTAATRTATGPPLTVVSTSPATGTQGVATDTPVTVRFSAPLAASAAADPVPALAPPVAGSWRRLDRYTLEFDPSAPFIPATTETLTVPGGPTGVRAAAGQVLGATTTATFSVASGSEERLEQLLALTGYLPLTFTPSGATPAPAQLAMPQTGTFTWRWGGLPASLTSQWTEGQPSALTKGAVMTLESQNSLTVDAIAGPRVWSVLLADLAHGTTNQASYTYVDVTKTLPENLTMWVDGVPKFQNIPVNTGVPGADTADGTYQVFEHVTASEMKGTNPDGSTYDDPNVPWASYFNGGDALHGFVRATYGSPQSNGCVEMSIADAGATWPYTPIGTLVTVEGPAAA